MILSHWLKCRRRGEVAASGCNPRASHLRCDNAGGYTTGAGGRVVARST
jgi:hypothetical protein